MDIQLLSGLVGELILDRDEVGLPGVGAFVAEVVPASFSDKGFTINPPYRRLSFRAGGGSDDSIATLYASEAGLTQAAAAAEVAEVSRQIKSELNTAGGVGFHGLGKLRMTDDGVIFFISDQDLDIFPAGFGLEPLSLKSRQGAAVAATPKSSNETPAAQEAGSNQASSETAPAEPGTDKPTPTPRKHTGRKIFKGILWTLAAIVVLLAAYILAARLFPDFVNSLLYTPEELQILGL